MKNRKLPILTFRESAMFKKYCVKLDPDYDEGVYENAMKYLNFRKEE
jgi:hypothetical protein